MNNPVRILSISDDDGLRYSRELLLAKDGYDTESMSSNSAISVSLARAFDVVLICRSVEPERAMYLADLLRNYNLEIQILMISPLERQREVSALDIEIQAGPETLLEAVRQVSRQKADGKACYEGSHR